MGNKKEKGTVHGRDIAECCARHNINEALYHIGLLDEINGLNKDMINSVSEPDTLPYDLKLSYDNAKHNLPIAENRVKNLYRYIKKQDWSNATSCAEPTQQLVYHINESASCIRRYCVSLELDKMLEATDEKYREVIKKTATSSGISYSTRARG